MAAFHAQDLVLVSFEHDHACPPQWRTSGLAQDARPTSTAIRTCWTPSGDHGIGSACPPEFMRSRRDLVAPLLAPRESAAADAGRQTALPGTRVGSRGKAPCGADCSRTESDLCDLAGAPGPSTRRLRHASPPAVHCATGTEAAQLPPARFAPTACVRRRPQKTVTVATWPRR